MELLDPIYSTNWRKTMFKRILRFTPPNVAAALLLWGATATAQVEVRNPSGVTDDHLIPGIDFDGYGREYYPLLKQTLLRTPADCARMITIPSSGGESSVSVYSK